MENYNVYKITCLINNKLYIGYTKHTINHRLTTHFRNAKKGTMLNNKFSRAILKYGNENFIIELIISTNSKIIALEKEEYFIKFYNTLKNGYNSTKGGELGGNGINHADFSGNKNPFYNKKHTNETKIKIGNRCYKNGIEHHLYGKIQTTSFRKGKEHPKSKQIKINGVIYESIRMASDILKINRPKLKKIGEVL